MLNDDRPLIVTLSNYRAYVISLPEEDGNKLRRLGWRWKPSVYPCHSQTRERLNVGKWFATNIWQNRTLRRAIALSLKGFADSPAMVNDSVAFAISRDGRSIDQSTAEENKQSCESESWPALRIACCVGHVWYNILMHSLHTYQGYFSSRNNSRCLF